MKVIAGNFDVTEFVSKMTWSGDIVNVSRKLNFEIVYKADDYYLNQNRVNIKEGHKITLQTDKGKILFIGIVIDMSYAESKNTISYTVFDYMFYVNHSEVSLVIKDTAENITKKICGQLGVKTGNIVTTGIKQYQAFLPINAYKGIVKVFEKAESSTGKKYMAYMNKDNLEVAELGKKSGVILDGESNIIDIGYKISIANLVNKVITIDKKGKIIKKDEDKKTQKKYGTIQKIIKKEKDNNNKGKVKLHGVDRDIDIEGLSDLRAIAGKSIVFIDPATEKEHEFLIKADKHIFTEGKARMSLSLTLLR